MNLEPNPWPTPIGPNPPQVAEELPSPPGQMPVVLAALAIGILLMGIQLWLLTVALDLYLSGAGGRVWQLALASGAIFLGGLAIVGLLRRRPRVHRRVISEAESPPSW